MANNTKKAIMKAKIEGVIHEIYVKTTADQVDYNGTTVAAALAQLITDVSNLDTASGVDKKIEDAINGLINGAPGTYDTLKEIADYIAAHEDVVTALNQAIGAKADASTVTTLSDTVAAIKTVTDGLGSVAKLNAIAESNLDSDLATKINGKANIYYSTTQPANLNSGDLWINLTT